MQVNGFIPNTVLYTFRNVSGSHRGVATWSYSLRSCNLNFDCNLICSDFFCFLFTHSFSGILTFHCSYEGLEPSTAPGHGHGPAPYFTPIQSEGREKVDILELLHKAKIDLKPLLSTLTVNKARLRESSKCLLTKKVKLFEHDPEFTLEFAALSMAAMWDFQKLLKF